MPQIRVKISDTSHYLPPRCMTNADISAQIVTPQYADTHDDFLAVKTVQMLPPTMLERLFGSVERRYSAVGEQVSDIAAKAALPIVERRGRENIDLLIFAAATADMIEPATANMVQAKLGLKCPVFDLKNACNSVVSAIQVATALIQSGQYRNVLIANGEKLQDGVKFEIEDFADLKRHMAAYTLGDAGAAILLEKSDDQSGIVFQNYKSRGQYWKLCTVPGGGSAFPRSGNHNFFQGKTSEMRQVFLEEFGDMLTDCFTQSGWKVSDVDHFFMHQVSVSTFDAVAERGGFPRDRFIESFAKYGNIAAASIPLNLSEAVAAGKLKKGDKVMVIGLGAGITLGVQLMIW
jgi:3-oxoacyl-[acyl-carrier-protein] synthase-3